MTEAFNESLDELSDGDLIAAVRAGNTAGYGVLYERHLGPARRAAACLASTAAERDDLVAEAFTRVLRALRAGSGPTEEFRPYLLVTMRNAAINSSRRNVIISLYADVPDTRPDVDDDPVGTRMHAEVAAEAFATLPERWRTVLWHTEIEGESPATVAPLLGLTPNSVAALAYRAREGLRQAYLQQYLPAVARRECRETARQLAGWVRRNISPLKSRRIAAHLDRCPECRELADSLVQINGELRAVIGPLILGAPLALGYLTAPATSSGAVLASTVSWMSAAKVAIAGAAIVTATTALPSASPPEALPGVAGPAVTAPTAPPARSGSGPATERRQPAGTPEARPVPAGETSTTTPAPAETGVPAGDKPAKEKDQPAGEQGKRADKAERKAEKAQQKADKKAEKEAEKGKEPKPKAK